MLPARIPDHPRIWLGPTHLHGIRVEALNLTRRKNYRFGTRLLRHLPEIPVPLGLCGYMHYHLRHRCKNGNR